MTSQKSPASRLLIRIAFMTSCLISGSAFAGVQFHWEARFSPADQKKLKQWVMETHGALEELVGELPFDMHVYFHKRRSREPVPWAHTQRSWRRQGVHFHVDPSFSLQDFRKDWTASHEMSHLILPYLGRSNSWFAEGFASYMQYQVMEQMGVLSKDAMERRYMRNLRRAERNYNRRSWAFADAASSLKREGKYPTMYWGGAAYFLQVNDKLMKSRQVTLVDVLRDYVDCCRRNDGRLDALAVQLNNISETRAFTDTLARFRSKPGFPDYRPMVPNAVP